MKRLIVSTVLATAGFALVGCASTAAPPASPTGAASTATGTGSAPSAATATVDPCTLITPADANTATGATDMAKDGPSSAHACAYNSSNGNVAISLFNQAYDADQVARKLAATNSTPIVISGLGDYAYVEAPADGMVGGQAWAKGFNVQILVGATDKDPTAAVRTLLQVAVGHLP